MAFGVAFMAIGLGVVLNGIGVALLLAARPVSTALAVGSQLRVTLTATFMDYTRVEYALHLADDADPGRSARLALLQTRAPPVARRWTSHRPDDLIISLDWEQALAIGHVAAAVSALLLGAAVLLMAKGTQTHRVIGAAYVVALVLVNMAALSLHRENTFGVFHALAVASLVTIGVGLSPLLLGRRSPPVIATHAYCMTWSYAGLVAAGCGQLVVAVGPGDGSWAVPVVIATVLSISGVVIFGRVPATVDRMLAEQ